MPDWNPLLVGAAFGLVAALFWTGRAIVKKHAIAGVWMVVERRFWRSLVTNFAIAFLVLAVLSSLVAAIIWVLHGLVLRVV